MSVQEEFFIGWARGIATGLRRFLLPIGFGVLLGLPVMGVLLGGAADDPADARFGMVPGQMALADLPSHEALRGIILDSPSPLLHLPADARHLRGRTLLLAIGAMPAIKAPAGFSAYAASKAGVLRLVESYADELKRDGLRVNAVMPGTIDTPQNRAAMPDADPTGWVTPAQLAEAIAYLLSDGASGITGALVPVTGRG